MLNVPNLFNPFQLFLSVSDVGQCLTDAVKSLPHLKRLSRSLDLKFNPAFKKLSGKHFVSVECLFRLLEEGKVSPASDEFKEQIGRLLQTVILLSFANFFLFLGVDGRTFLRKAVRFILV